MQRRKLQVFVSSTFTDLQEERQAAVDAILRAGHIPAGMELFAAGDQSQLNVIRRWIEESDVYLLLLGGRYGSIERLSGKSYIHVEYDHAVALAKPLFAIVISPEALQRKVKRLGTSAFETDHPQEFAKFREQVLSNMVRFWSDLRDIKLDILETLSEFSTRKDITGWVPATNDHLDIARVVADFGRVVSEGAALREHLAQIEKERSRRPLQVCLPVRDIRRSDSFYGETLQLARLQFPQIAEIWSVLYEVVGGQLRLTENPHGTFSEASDEIDIYDARASLSVSNLESTFEKLRSMGHQVAVNQDVMFARYPSFFVRDPDGHVIEIRSERLGAA